jgi:DNA repair exonuclease SbcCD ATPase subunit
MSPKMRKQYLELLYPKYSALEDEIDEAKEELSKLEEKFEAMNDVIDALQNDGDPLDEDWEKVEDELPEFTNNQPTEEEVEIINILLKEAPLSGIEIGDLEGMLEDEDLVAHRYKEICNSHIHTIHAAQRNGSHFA